MSDHSDPASRSFREEALLVIRQLRAKVAQLETGAREPIAIVGLGCRVPGADGPSELWSLLRHGTDSVSEVDEARWSMEEYFDPEPATPGKMYSRWAGTISGLDQFDAPLFGVTEHEAGQMDPQQRLLLECVWEAIEDSGVFPRSLGGSSTGVFVGISSGDYQDAKMRHLGDAKELDFYSLTGMWRCLTVGRVSYTLDLWGPNEPVDTACSSSLVAIHRACQALRANECNLAIAGGVNTVIGPEVAIMVCQGLAMSKDGRCKTFDGRADGFVRSDGCVMFALKRLREAQRDGDEIWAVIRGIAVNHDGRSQGITAPNGLAQQQVVRRALADASLTPDDIDYVECHGTGTRLGDPQETGALASVFQSRGVSNPVFVGSIKSNVGHMEAAAGAAGIAKVALCLSRGELAPSIHVQQINRNIPIERMPLSVVTQRRPWPRRQGLPRRAGVSSFGISGTNAHAVIEEAPQASAHLDASERSSDWLGLSAHTHKALQALASRYVVLLKERPELHLSELANTLRSSGQRGEHRATVHFDSRAQLIDALLSLANGKARDTVSNSVVPKGEPSLGMLFPDVSTLTRASKLSLYDRDKEYRAAIDLHSSVISGRLEVPLKEVVIAGSMADRPSHARPALVAHQLGLVESWRARGVEAAATMGWGAGEYAAACAAGTLSSADALALAHESGRLIEALPKPGSMLEVLGPVEAIRTTVARRAGRISAALTGGPQNALLCGEMAEMQELQEELHRLGLRTRSVGVGAFHSPVVQPIMARFERFASSLEHRSPQIPFLSASVGAETTPNALLWRQHLIEPMRVERAASALAKQCTAVLELGPTPSLVSDTVFEPVRLPGGETVDDALVAEAGMFLHGVDLAGSASRRKRLVRYPFQRSSYRLRPESGETSLRGGHETPQPLLGYRIRSALASVQFEGRLGARRPVYLADHQVNDTVIVPGSLHVELAFEAANEIWGEQPVRMSALRLERALTFQPGEECAVQVVLTPDWVDEATCEIYSEPTSDAEPWALHARCKLHQAAPAKSELHEHPAAIRNRTTRIIDTADFYRTVRSAGMQYGPKFRVLSDVRSSPDGSEILARLELVSENAADASKHRVHPILLDASAQAMLALQPAIRIGKGEARSYWPVRVKEIRSLRPVSATGFCHVVERPSETEGLCADLTFMNADGEVCFSIEEFQLEPIPDGAVRSHIDSAQDDLSETPLDWIYQLDWSPSPHRKSQPVEPPPSDRAWLILTEEEDAAQSLLDKLDVGTSSVLGIGNTQPSELGEAILAALTTLDATDLLLMCGFGSRPAPPSPDALREEFKLSVRTLLLIAQTLVQRNLSAQRVPRLWVATQNLQPIDLSGPMSVWHGPLVGLARNITREHPELRCCMIDVAGPSDQVVELLARELRNSDSESEVALRPTGRFIPALQRASVSITETQAELRPDGAYLITGGLGGLGIELAKWMCRRGAGHIVLMGRRPADQRIEDRLAPLRASGVSLQLEQGDVTVEADVARVLASARASGRALRGIAHLAGRVQDRILTRQDWSSFMATLGPKAIGAWILHEQTKEDPLDLFLMFGSVTGIVGQPGQSNHAAACAFEDYFATYRQGLGLPALSLDYTPWREVGGAARPELLRALGTAGMSNEQGLSVIDSLLASGRPQFGVFQGSWWHLKPHESGPSLLSRWSRSQQRTPREPVAAPTKPDASHRPSIEAALTEIWTSVFGARTAITPDAEFFSLGGDSLIAMRLVSTAARKGIKFGVSDLFEHPTVRKLSEMVEKKRSASGG